MLKTRILGAWRGLAAKQFARRVAKDEIQRRLEAERLLAERVQEAAVREESLQGAIAHQNAAIARATEQLDEQAARVQQLENERVQQQMQKDQLMLVMQLQEEKDSLREEKDALMARLAAAEKLLEAQAAAANSDLKPTALEFKPAGKN